MLKLKRRLAAIAEKIPAGATIADIGTDHAYLPVFLVQNELVSKAVAVEVHQGPYLSAKETIDFLGLQDKISLRFGNGLAVINPGEADTVVIAGMGGKTILEILMINPVTTQSLNRLILQPMIGADLVRRWLVQHGWYIMDESLAIEDRIYEIIVAKQGIQIEFEDILFEIGPILWEQKHPLLKQHIKQMIDGYQKVLAGLSLRVGASESDRYIQVKKKITQLEARLICL